jgi:hypothetical protein
MNLTEKRLHDQELQARVDTATTTSELEEIREVLIGQQKGIEQQLASRNRTDEFGVRVSEADYWKWRDKAMFAMSQIQKTLSRSKLRLKQMRREIAIRTQTGAPLGKNTCDDLLCGALALLRKLNEDVEFTEDEIGFLHALRDYVEDHAAVDKLSTTSAPPRPEGS